MKVKYLIEALQILNPESEVVVQVNHGEGINFHALALMSAGHIGYSGPIIMAGEPIEFETQKIVSP